MTDRALYEELQSRMWKIMQEQKAHALSNQEYKACFQLVEAIKNKYGGMPPKKETE